MKTAIRLIFLVILSSAAIGAETPDSKSLRVVATFDEGIQNQLGGYHNKFESAPSRVVVSATEETFRGESGQSLKIQASQKSGGFCGAWMHLFDMRADPKKYFDARNYAFLSFWVKGAKGGEDFTVKMADETWIGKEDSVAVGPIKQFLPGGVTRDWQEVLIPLAKLDKLDRMNMGGITFDFTSPGETTVYIDDVSFKTSPKIATPETRKSSAATAPQTSLPRAMWVWNTEPVLLDPAVRGKLLDLCKQENIDLLWIQLDYDFDPKIEVYVQNEPPPAAIRCVLKHKEKLREFLREAHAAGVKVHALDGFPEYALKAYHPIPMAAVDAVVAFNKESKPEERYDGIHFDNEPYLIIGWHDPAVRTDILKNFLELNTALQKQCRQNSLVFGVDIPFWWQEKDEKTGKISGMVNFNGVDKPASFHCVDILDNVGVMDYRDTADGADGIIAHGRDLLAYADQAKKAKIYVGLETFTYQPTKVMFATGLPRARFEQAIRAKAADFAMRSRINGFRIQVFEDGANVHVGIELPAKPSPEQEAKATRTMAEIARRFGASADPELKAKADQIRMDAEFGVSADVEWDDARSLVIKNPEGASYSGFTAMSIMLPKITFADENYEHLQTQMKAAEKEFRKHPSFAGFAIHYFDTYLEKVEQARRTPSK